MLQAAFLAGFRRVHFAYEPVAAAYAYTLREDFRAETPQTLLIFDFGGGTLDISIVRSEGVRSHHPGRATAPLLTVLASGGIALAGDAFDSRIVRRKLTAPFGEGSDYLSDGRPLPVPAAYYDAFASWQDLLALQQPHSLESLRRIARNAREPERIQALIRLITSHYGLRLFELAEAAKRRLSSARQARLQLAEDGLAFDVPLSRREFERLIRPDRRRISARIDEVLASADLRPEQIDAVLRTGGSAQIPCFVALLEERFGPARVRAMDIFSSVTAGLAIIARRLDEGLPPGTLASADHTAENQPSPALRPAPDTGQLPRVPLAQMQQLIDLRLKPAETAAGLATTCLIALDGAGSLVSRPLEAPLPEAIPLSETGLQPPARLLPRSERLLLLTSVPRLLARPVSWLQELAALGSTLESFERFESDAFGQERICHFAPVSELLGARRLLLLTRRAYGQPLAAESTLQRLQLSAALRLELPPRVGDPFALLPLYAGGSLLLLTGAGRLMRLPAAAAEEGRLLSLTGKAHLRAAHMISEEGLLVLARADGRLATRHSAEIPLPDQRPMALRGVIAIAPVAPGGTLWALTDWRLLRVFPEADRLRLQLGERLLSLLPA